MGENTKIEWADHTFNPWIGCAHVSKGCMNCYAERDFDHRYHKVEWGPRGTRVKTGDANWRKPFKWNKHAQENGKVELVFCASLADVFEDPVSPDYSWDLGMCRERLFDMMQKTPWLIWLVLTKRPENVMFKVPHSWRTIGRWPANVWVGFSAEDQSNFDYRIGYALDIPTPVLWVSAEPLLGLIHMEVYLDTPEIHWVIAGGESGPKARAMHPNWARHMRDQCAMNRVPFFFKQHGEYIEVDESQYIGERLGDGLHGNYVPILRVGRKKAGRELDGKEHLAFPAYIEEYELNLDIEHARAAVRIERE